MKLVTASAVVSLARKLETDSAVLYEELSARYPDRREAFLSCARENRKFAADIERAYYGVISDAIEGCFAFDLETGGDAFQARGPQVLDEAAAVAWLLDMERKILQFDLDAAGQSRSCIADVSRAFQTVARKRAARISSLSGAS